MPPRAANQPAEHSSHLPVLPATMPSAQAEQAPILVEAAGEVLPGAHTVHAEEPVASAYRPGLHFSQYLRSLVEYLPVGHVGHCDSRYAPLPQSNRPTGQNWHSIVPTRSVNLPRGHCAQPVDPSKWTNFPCGQLVQKRESIFEYWPAWARERKRVKTVGSEKRSGSYYAAAMRPACHGLPC